MSVAKVIELNASSSKSMEDVPLEWRDAVTMPPRAEVSNDAAISAYLARGIQIFAQLRDRGTRVGFVFVPTRVVDPRNEVALGIGCAEQYATGRPCDLLRPLPHVSFAQPALT